MRPWMIGAAGAGLWAWNAITAPTAGLATISAMIACVTALAAIGSYMRND